MGELGKRILTALILIPAVVAGVLLLPTTAFGFVLALVMLAAAEEWAKLAGLFNRGVHSGFVIAIAGAIGIGAWLMSEGHGVPLFAVAAIWWLWTARRVLVTPPIQVLSDPDPEGALAGVVVLVPAWAALVWMHELVLGPPLVLSLLVLIWLADSGAYFAGRRWGRRKLAPLVSPGKTLEGLAGALAVSVLWGGLLGAVLEYSTPQSFAFLALCLITVLASVVGDLYESLMKRKRGLKDSGALLPGHGGVLDRIDSLTAAAPVFALGLHLGGLAS